MTAPTRLTTAMPKNLASLRKLSRSVPAQGHLPSRQERLRINKKDVEVARTQAFERWAKLARSRGVAERGIFAACLLDDFVESLAALTEREREVLIVFVEEPSDKEVSLRLGTSVQTVRNQMVSIMRKLGVNSREAMIRVLLVAWFTGNWTVCQSERTST
jgi:DNA-binding CsgD family transcriptional regulator